ncbi:MAG: tol-pal system-associated acyl-CoA thioesterase [Betaproteobacteria bacterium]|jgi:acyl-CoA thioester hydrolase
MEPAPPAADFSILVRAYFQDTDAGGIVYHARYLDFFERCRMDWLRALGLPATTMARDHGVMFVVHALRIDYLRPARLDDELSVSLVRGSARGAQLPLRQTVDRDGEMLVSAEVSLACVNAGTLRPARLPGALRARLTVPDQPAVRPPSFAATTP